MVPIMTTIHLNYTLVVNAIPTSSNGCVSEERRFGFFSLPIRTCIESYGCEAVVTVVGNIFVTHSHQHDGVIIP